MDIDPFPAETTATITIQDVQDMDRTVLSPNPTSCLVRYVLDPACAPVMTCTNVVAECTGGLTPVTFSVTASNASGPVPVACVPPSGSGFRPGASNVVCAASNSTVTGSFTVTVVDTTPPRIFCPGDIADQTSNAAGTVISYTAGASDPCGIQGETYVVQASSDLVNWSNIGTGQANSDGDVEVALDDPGAYSQTVRFYRVASP